MHRLAFALVVLWLAVPWCAASGLAPTAELEQGATARIAEVVDGDTVVLDSGDELRLVGIQAPKLPLGRPDFTPWPLAAEAKAALEALCLGRRVTLAYGGRRSDRHGRLLAHLTRDDGVWIQGELLRRGFARVYSFRDNRARVADMLALEREARAAKRGIWSHPYYAVRSGDKARNVPLDSFEIVEGRVLAAAVVNGRAYLNFGDNWRTDFTASVAPRDRRAFEREGHDLLALEGRVIRVRGWVKLRNGPMIEVTHPEQIEVLPQ
ncbi:MAG: thermonuclease family protein [Alphaproteobacteria bacterium]